MRVQGPPPIINIIIMRHLKYIASIALAVLLSSGCGQYMDEPGQDSGKVSVTLELHPEQPSLATRATDETIIEDVNVFFYNNGLSHHFYATGATHTIDIAPGTYSIEVAINQHRDLGELTLNQFYNYQTDAPSGGSLTMYGHAYKKIDLTSTVIPISVKRNAAKIAYNITVAPDEEIEILSVQLCSMPNKDYLVCEDQMDVTDPSYGFYDSEVRTLPTGTKNAAGIFYMLSNRRGKNNTIKDQKEKNAKNAPANSSYLHIRGRSGGNKVVDYVVYLGANNTSDFNVWPNEAHTYNITLSGDSETDTRITSYTLDVSDWWPRTYNVPDNDYGELDIYVTNKGDYTFTGKLKVTTGDGEKFAAGDGEWNYGPNVDLWMPKSGGQRYDLRYAPTLIKKGVNSQVQYQVTVSDNAGESTTFNFSSEFANMVQAYFPSGTGSVTVAGALQKSSTMTAVTAYCYEDGCTFTAADGNGYAFDGWYADQAYTQLLSASASYKHAPTKAKTAIYARFALVKQPKVEITCNEVNKNSTYMYNRNTVTMTVTDYSGPVTIKASCATGGLFSSTTSFSKTVTSGQSFTLDPLVFVPTATGNVSYTIDVTTSTGIKIGSKTVTNNITATKLTPTIQIDYGGKTRQTLYKPANSTSSVYWYGYTTVVARVTFSPELDYPTPIETAQLLKIQLYPSHQVSEVVGADDPGSGYWGVQFLYPSYPDITVPDFKEIAAKYTSGLNNSYTLAATADITYNPARNSPLFAPYTDGETFLALPVLESEAITAKLMDREFVKYSFNKPALLPSQISVSKIYSKNDLQIVSDIKLIIVTNNL